MNQYNIDAMIFRDLYKPAVNSHKGQNGRLLVIGGSKLFHASIFWSADVASKIVDLVHFCSPAGENGDLVRKKAKEGFWNGIVVDWSEVEQYIQEDECILIGPGMVRAVSAHATSDRAKGRAGELQDTSLGEAGERGPSTVLNLTGSGRAPSIHNSASCNRLTQSVHEPVVSEGRQDDKTVMNSLTVLSDAARMDDTRTIVNTLLKKYPEKKWVVDGGALQEADPKLLNGNMIITPHLREFIGLMERSLDQFLISNVKFLNNLQYSNDQITKAAEVVSYMSKHFGGVTVLLKGQVDIVCRGGEWVVIEGGNAGMTKGGTGDVLAGLVAALYCKNEVMLAAQVGSNVNKKAGESLAKRVGIYYSAGDLVAEVPRVLAEVTG